MCDSPVCDRPMGMCDSPMTLSKVPYALLIFCWTHFAAPRTNIGAERGHSSVYHSLWDTLRYCPHGSVAQSASRQVLIQFHRISDSLGDYGTIRVAPWLHPFIEARGAHAAVVSRKVSICQLNFNGKVAEQGEAISNSSNWCMSVELQRRSQTSQQAPCFGITAHHDVWLELLQSVMHHCT